jgi:subtilisin family serine protease
MLKLSILLVTFPLILLGQSKESLKLVIEKSNISELNKLKANFVNSDKDKDIRISSFLINNPEVKAREVLNGKTIELVDVINNEPIFAETSNFTGGVSIRANHLYSGGTLGLNVQGQGMSPAIWDNGAVNASHIELENRVSIMDTPTTIGDHASHVGGTMVATGLANSSRGVAFNASLKSYDWNTDLAEITAEATDGLLMSNHSYIISPPLAAWHFGAYDDRARNIDQILYNAPYYTSVWAAGNDRTNSNSLIQNQISATGGYELIRNQANAKNHILVGAVQGVSFYTGPSDVIMSTFSSWGPTDDGRIKPDIVAKGVSVFSTGDESSNHYYTAQGTSMASPMITGGVTLLQQHYNNVFSNYMRSSTVKGLLTNTADEAGDFDGPDYRFGWGLANLRKAALTISNKQNGLSIIDEISLNSGSSYTTSVGANGTEPLKITICWTDPAFPFPNSGFVNPTTRYTVNDLDIRVTKDGVTYFPWKLDRNDPTAAATRNSDNNIDVIETIQIDNPSGVYNITVNHKNVLTNGSQLFSLIATGPILNLSSLNSNISNISMYPNPANDFVFISYKDVSLNKIEVYDINGRKVISVLPDVDYSKIQTNELTPGVYFVKLSGDQIEETQKLIIK